MTTVKCCFGWMKRKTYPSGDTSYSYRTDVETLPIKDGCVNSTAPKLCSGVPRRTFKRCQEQHTYKACSAQCPNVRDRKSKYAGTDPSKLPLTAHYEPKTASGKCSVFQTVSPSFQAFMADSSEEGGWEKRSNCRKSFDNRKGKTESPKLFDSSEYKIQQCYCGIDRESPGRSWGCSAAEYTCKQNYGSLNTDSNSNSCFYQVGNTSNYGSKVGREPEVLSKKGNHIERSGSLLCPQNDLDNLSRKRVIWAEHVERPLNCWLGKLGIPHVGVVVTTEDGEEWLVHKAKTNGTMDTVVTGVDSMTLSWSVKASRPVSRHTLGDFVEASGSKYNLFTNNCWDSRKRMMKLCD